MKRILKKIHNNTSGSAIIIGGVAKWLNGYTKTYGKKWIDVSITSEYSSSLDSLGTRLELDGGTTFPLPITDQFVIKTTDGYVLDVFIQDEPSESHIVSGSNVITPQGDVDFHEALYIGVGTDYLLNRLNDRKALYGIE